MDEQKGRSMNELTVILWIIIAILAAVVFALRKLGSLHKQEMEQKQREQQL